MSNRVAFTLVGWVEALSVQAEVVEASLVPAQVGQVDRALWFTSLTKPQWTSMGPQATLQVPAAGVAAYLPQARSSAAHSPTRVGRVEGTATDSTDRMDNRLGSATRPATSLSRLWAAGAAWLALAPVVLVMHLRSLSCPWRTAPNYEAT